MKSCGFLAWLFLPALAFAADALECRWADTPPVIDGHPDDAVWQRAMVVDDFRAEWLPGAPKSKERTRARLLWDREWIYFLAELDDTDVTADVREHDGQMWKNDVFEIFFHPSTEHYGYYEFEVNPFGAVFDAFFPSAESHRDPQRVSRHEFHVEAKVVVRGTLNKSDDRDTGWLIEGRIPWSDFNWTGGRPAPGETWRVNLTRVNGREPGNELTSASPLTKPSFHRKEDFAALRFVGPAPLPRAAWKNEKLLGSPDGPASYATTRVWPKLEPRSMVTFLPMPGGEWTWFIDQESGWDGPMRVRRMRTGGDGSDAETLMDQLDDLYYSAIFHPKFAENGYVYFGANGPRSSRPRSSRVVRYTVRDGKPDPASRTIIIEWPSDGHNGAALAFSNDGLLFVTSGDGTSTSDLDRVGQEPSSLRAKILRIDVDHPAPGKNYSVPRDNPFVDDKRFRPETWAYGLRNPWRLTYDSVSGQLWSGENGQDQWEYARLVQRGANYGWSAYEGGHPFIEKQPMGPHPVTFPTIEFSHAEFRSLTGGIVYRGKNFPELVGAYVFGDFNTGRVWAAKHDGTRLEWMRELIDTPFALSHVTADAAGELVLLDYGGATNLGQGTPTGGIHRLDRAPPPRGPVPEFPKRLSATGLFSDLAKLTPAAGIVRYEINAPGWHDGATSDHLLAVPAGTMLEVRPQQSWMAANETVLAQTLTLDGKRIETRVLVKQQNDWAGYTYVWNSAQSDAVLAEKTGAEITVGASAQPWRVPSRAECMMCHSRQANFALSLNEAQLNRGDQLAQWERLGLLKVDPAAAGRRGGGRFGGRSPDQGPQRTPVVSSLMPRNPENLRRFAPPADAQATLESRARAYLAVNCAHCHTQNGGGNSVMDFDWNAFPDRMRAVGQTPQHGDLGIAGARVIAAGAPERSVLIPRMGTRAPGQMPPVGTRTSDSAGLRLMAEWIASLRE